MRPGSTRSAVPVIPTQILRVLSTIRTFDVSVLLMGGQACVLYGAAEYSRDLDLAVLASPEAWPKLTEAMRALRSTVIAVPPFEALYLERGHKVHLSVPDERSFALRVDLMSCMRGVDSFDALWERRVTIVLPSETMGDVAVDMLGLEDIVAAKKTQRDKDWPMIRRLVDASYAAGRDGDVIATTAYHPDTYRPTKCLRSTQPDRPRTLSRTHVPRASPS